jgi:hypothetical protein
MYTTRTSMNATPDTSQQTHTHKFNEGDRLTEGNTLRATITIAVMTVVG